MSSGNVAVPLLVVVAACATAPVEKEPWPLSDTGASNASAESFNPARFAAEFAGPLDCERGARRLRSSSDNDAWRALKACVARGYFPRLDQLASPAWAHDLRTRPDAPALLCRVIAMQGGSVDHDLRLLHQQRVPLFSLEDGLSAPPVYTGHNIVLRGRVNEVRADRGSLTAKIEEMTTESAAFDAPVGYGFRSRGRGRGPFSWSTDYSAYRTIRRYDNVPKETGREALLRLPAPDPFLVPGREFIILARLDGVRETSNSEDNDEPDFIPVLTLISYAEPNALAIY